MKAKRTKTPKAPASKECACGHVNALHAGYVGDCAMPKCECKEFQPQKNLAPKRSGHSAAAER